MRPNARVWRRNQRAAQKGTLGGRRSTHKAETQEPQPSSTWTRRHPARVVCQCSVVDPHATTNCRKGCS